MNRRSLSRSGNERVASSEPPILSVGALRLSLAEQEALVGGRSIHLNYMECLVLRKLIEERPHVVTRTDLMKAAWGTSIAHKTSIIDEMVVALREKLGEEVKITIFPRIGYSID